MCSRASRDKMTTLSHRVRYPSREKVGQWSRIRKVLVLSLRSVPSKLSENGRTVLKKTFLPKIAHTYGARKFFESTRKSKVFMALVQILEETARRGSKSLNQ